MLLDKPVTRKAEEPMQKNDTLSLTCERLGAELEGVCHADGMAVFVPGLLPGETARVHIVKVQPSFAFGRLESITGAPSPERIEPDCAAYPLCGGCTGRHMRYEATLAAKMQQVTDCFRRIGHLSVDVQPVIGMRDPSAYRNKTALPIGGTADSPQIGFFAPRSHRIIPISGCPNTMPPTSTIADALLAWMRKYGIEPYHEESHSGLIRHLMVRVNRSGEALVCVVANADRLPREHELADCLTASGAIGVVLNTNRARTNAITGPVYRTLRGSGALTDTLCGLRFSISPAAFFQVNPVQTEVLYRTAVSFADLKPSDLVCDLYCGAGTISLTMAASCRRVIGIEIVPQAIDNAHENARANGVTNVEFRCGAVEAVLPGMIADGLRPDVIVVDPPRKGLDPAVIRAMDEACPRKIVYVSCNPATLARDAGLLHDLGWEVNRVQPVDMFCWTSDVETVVSLSKGEISSKPVRVEFSLEGLDTSCLLNDATYQQIKDYVLEHTGLHVSNL